MVVVLYIGLSAINRLKSHYVYGFPPMDIAISVYIHEVEAIQCHPHLTDGHRTCKTSCRRWREIPGLITMFKSVSCSGRMIFIKLIIKNYNYFEKSNFCHVVPS